MKVSFSVSDEIARQLSVCANTVADGNASLVTEVALAELLKLPVEEIGRLVARQRLDRKATTRSGWMQAFWQILGESLGQPDFQENPYAPRNFGGFYAVLLLNHVGRQDDEEDPFVPYVGPMPIMPDSQPPFQWTFARSTSPITAAESVAIKLREYGVTIPAKGKEMTESRSG